MNVFMNRNIFNLTPNAVVQAKAKSPETNSTVVASTTNSKHQQNNNKPKSNTENNTNTNRFTQFFSNISPMLKNKKHKHPIPIKTETGTIPAIAVRPLPPHQQQQIRPRGIRANYYDEPFVYQTYKQRMEMLKRNLKQEKLALISKYANKMKQQAQPPIKSKADEKEQSDNKQQLKAKKLPNRQNNNESKKISIETKTVPVPLANPKTDNHDDNAFAESEPAQLENIEDEIRCFNKKTRKLSYRMSFTNLSTVKEENEFDEYHQKYLQNNTPLEYISDEVLKKSSLYYFKPQQASFIYDNKKSFLQNDINSNYSKKLETLKNVNSEKSAPNSYNIAKPNSTKIIPSTSKPVSVPPLPHIVQNTFTPIQNNVQKQIDINFKNSIGRNNNVLRVLLNQEQQQKQQQQQHEDEIKQVKVIQIINNYNNNISPLKSQQQSQKLVKISPSSQVNKLPPPPIVSPNTNKSNTQKLASTPNITPTAVKTPKIASPVKSTSIYNSYLYTPSQNETAVKFQSDFSKISEFGLIKVEDTTINKGQSIIKQEQQPLSNINKYLTHSTSDPLMFSNKEKMCETSGEVSKTPNNSNYPSLSCNINSSMAKTEESEDFYKNIYNYNINEKYNDYSYDYISYLNGNYDEATKKINKSIQEAHESKNFLSDSLNSTTNNTPTSTTMTTNTTTNAPSADSNISVNIKYYNYDDYCNIFYKNNKTTAAANESNNNNEYKNFYDFYNLNESSNKKNENYYFKELYNNSSAKFNDSYYQTNKDSNDKTAALIANEFYSAVY